VFDVMTGDPTSSPRACAQGRRRALAPAESVIERARILAAAQRLVLDDGVECLTATAVRERAGVDVRAFNASFADLGELLLALFDGWISQAAEGMTLAYAAHSSWVDAVRAALLELLCFFDSAPPVARFLVLGSVSADTALTARRRAVLADLAFALDAGSPREDGEGVRAPFGAEAVVGTVVAVIHGRLLEEPVPCLCDLAGALMAVILTAYLNPEAARRELVRSPDRPKPRALGSARADTG
jgi:AcrR family transcriptional regulator